MNVLNNNILLPRTYIIRLCWDLIGNPNKNNGKYFYLIVKNTLVKLEHPTSDVCIH
jgi:hypothetical protein